MKTLFIIVGDKERRNVVARELVGKRGVHLSTACGGNVDTLGATLRHMSRESEVVIFSTDYEIKRVSVEALSLCAIAFGYEVIRIDVT